MTQQKTPTLAEKKTRAREVDSKYKDYFSLIKLHTEIDRTNRDLSKKKSDLKTISSKITDGKLATIISDHAVSQILTRLEKLCSDSPRAYSAIMSGKTSTSLFVPSNLSAFILENIKSGLKSNSVKEKKSRSGGKEYVYDIKMTQYDTDDKYCVFSLVVENNTVKTGYFNLIG